jgi:hypothetical protein
MTAVLATAASDRRARPAARARHGTALLICVGLALFVVASRLEAAVGAFVASSPSVGALQLAAAALVGLWAGRVARSPSRHLLRSGAVGACLLVAAWTATRTIGLAGPAAPVGLLDAMTALDELLLAAFALAAAGTRGARWDGWSALGSVAISLSFVALAMGCEPAAAPAAGGGVAPLVCHLY